MTLINRYSITGNGSMLFTGNTLGLTNNNSDISAFITLNNASQVPGFPFGTTLLWQDNGSRAQFSLPAGSTVLYAELQWGGTYNSLIINDLDTPIKFTSPSSTYTISPDPITSQEGPIFYSRSQNVTSIIKSDGNGVYSVEGVPSQINSLVASAGWTLGIIYYNQALSIQNMTIFSGIEEIGAAAPPVDFNLSGFITPSTGPVNGRVLISAMEGDFNIGGDMLLIGPNIGGLIALSGPNNPSNNFFRSQINNGDSESISVGQLDTTGTFGNINVPTNLPARYGFDITNVLSNNFVNNQTSAVIRITSTGDGYAVPLFGIQLDASPLDFGDAPDISAGNGIGDYSTLLANNGPRHLIVNDLTLGVSITNEIDAYENATATGDDLVKGVQDDGVTVIPAIVLGENSYSIDINYINNTGSIANLYAWVDFNQNGIFELEESANLTLLPSSGSGLKQTTLNFTIPSGFSLVAGAETFMRIRITTDSLVNTNVLNNAEDTRSLGLASDGEVEDYRVFVVSFEVKGVVWYDENCDGIRDLGELLVSDANVSLYNSDTGELVATTTTDVNGAYSFTEVPSGNYYLLVELPNGYMNFTLPNVGNNVLVSSNVNQKSGKSDIFTLSESIPSKTVNAGLCKCFKISGQAFYDCNKNGVLENKEPYIYGVNVILFNDLGVQIESTFTDCDGYYEFPCLKPGDYTVQFIAPPSMDFSPQVLTQEYGSKPDATTGIVPITITTGDTNNIYAGFIGNLGMNIKYCNSCNNAGGCAGKKNNFQCGFNK